MIKHKLFFSLIALISSICYSQECADYQKLDNCRLSPVKNYKIYLQHKNAAIGIHDTLTYNISFSGNKDYILSFCTSQLYYPINIKLRQPETGKVLYNNASDNFNESVAMSLNSSQNIVVEVILLGKNLEKNKIGNNEKVCVGLDMQWKKIFSDLDELND